MYAWIRSHKIISIIGTVFILGLGFWLSQPSPRAAKGANSKLMPSMAKASLSVDAVQAQSVTWPMTVTLNGSVFAWQEALVSAEISGLRIKQILAEVGDRVKKGQVLVTLADETVQAELLKQLATEEKDKAALAEAQSNANRAREIKDSGALSAQKINEYMIAEQTAKANLALSQAELENQRIRLRQTQVLAPDDGLIATRSANLGNVVASGAELFRMVRQSRIEWRGEVSAEQLAALHPGQAVQLMLPEAGQRQHKVNGKVRLISPVVDSNTRNALVYVDIPAASARPGMYVQGAVDIGQQPGVAVPISSVVYRDGHAYVFVLPQALSGQQRVRQQKVSTGRTRGDQIEIIEGIASGSWLVNSGGAFLNDGDMVQVVQAPAGAAS